MNIIKSKKQMFIVIGAFALILLLGTASYAFFNYTRTGGENTVGIGRIYFNTDQGNDTLTLSNIFPMTSTQATNANLDSVAVHIQGDTTYNDGEEFEITLVNVTNTVNGKTIPINYTATYVASENKGIGASSDSYFTSRGSSSNVYQFTSTGEVSEGKQVLVGFIPKNGEVDGTLTIKAYIDSSKVVISDTLAGGAVEVTGYNNGYPNPGEGVTVLTTAEWNALEGAGTLKFSIRGIANEGVWVEEAGASAAVPEIESCPGCVYTWTYYEDARVIVGQPLSGSLTIAATNDYTELIDNLDEAYEDPNSWFSMNMRWFLGAKLNSSTNVVEKAYVCGIKNAGTQNEIPFCLEGVETTDPRYEEVMTSNSNIMNTVFGAGECDSSYSYLTCTEAETGGIYASNALDDPNYAGLTIGNNDADVSCGYTPDDGGSASCMY